MMSEYQYYEFQTVDGSLSEAQRSEMSRLSSRSEVTSHSAKFVYHYGDFRGNEKELLSKNFDAVIYMANWGTKRLMFRIPVELVNVKSFSTYCQSESMDVEKVSDKYIVIDFNFHEEEGHGWLDGEGWLDDLLALREELIQGDLRVLYLAWLKDIQHLSLDLTDDENVLEPAVPPGLAQLSPALQKFVEFYEIDKSLIAAAAKNSDELALQDKQLFRWIDRLPVNEQQDYLKRLSLGETNLTILLNRRLLDLANAEHPVKKTHRQPRKIEELLGS